MPPISGFGLSFGSFLWSYDHFHSLSDDTKIAIAVFIEKSMFSSLETPPIFYLKISVHNIGLIKALLLEIIRLLAVKYNN